MGWGWYASVESIYRRRVACRFSARYAVDAYCRTDLSLNDFPLPNVTEFINVAAPTPGLRPASPPPEDGGELPRNQWYYQYEPSGHRRHRHQHRPAAAAAAAGHSFQQRHGFRFTGNDVTVTWVSFLAILVTIDVVWFVHRMARTYSTAKMILYGWTAPGEGISRSRFQYCVCIFRRVCDKIRLVIWTSKLPVNIPKRFIFPMNVL